MKKKKIMTKEEEEKLINKMIISLIETIKSFEIIKKEDNNE